MKINGSLKINLIVLSLLIFLTTFAYSQQTLTSPNQFFGFKPGAEKQLFTYEQLISYLKRLDKQSDRLKLLEIGRSPEGKVIYIAFISDPKNLDRLNELKEINRKLALEPNLSKTEKEKLIRNGRVFVYATLSMHSSEVGPSQAAPLLAYTLVSGKKPNFNKYLNDVVYMFVPCHNPDGMNMVVNYYNKHKGTKYDGSSYPGVYHKYVGHNINRDFVTLSQKDNKAVAAVYNLTWFPQVMVEKHQMGSTGVRYYVPPNHDPIAENVDEGIWHWMGVFGANMAKDMTAKGQAGIAQHYIFDDYWPGSTETCIWKNVIGFLTEAASTRYASSIYIEPGELNVYGKGLSEYKKSINMPLPWPGGWWKLSDIVQYELESHYSILKTASNHKTDILRFRNDLCVKEVLKGKTVPPYFYILPKDQIDAGEWVNVVNLLMEHGIHVYQLNRDIVIADRLHRKGDIFVPLSQPFRAFVKEVLESQKFPLRHYTPGGEIIRPYDITSWSLPLHRGIRSIEVKSRKYLTRKIKDNLVKIEAPFKVWNPQRSQTRRLLFPVTRNESFKAAFFAFRNNIMVSRLTETVHISGTEYKPGGFVVTLKNGTSESILKKMKGMLNVHPVSVPDDRALKSTALKMPRIAVMETVFHDMDAGWTRFIFDQYGIPFKILRPAKLKGENLDVYDVIILPDSAKTLLMTGKYKSGGSYYGGNYAPKYTKGFGKKGFNKLLKFMDSGGTIVSWRRSTELFTTPLTLDHGKKKAKENFTLPVRDVSRSLRNAGLYVPGSFIRIRVKQDHPVSYGVPEKIGIFFRGSPVFRTSLPRFDTDRRVIASFPEEKLLLSGYAEKAKTLERKAAVVWVKKNKGQLVLMSFNPQFRASTQVTYKFLFNSLFL